MQAIGLLRQAVLGEAWYDEHVNVKWRQITVNSRPLILLTNDDGFDSPGLRAAAQALLALGEVFISAPVEQQSGAGRSLWNSHRARIHHRQLRIGAETVHGFAIEGTPATSVKTALLELSPRRPALCVSGINYGENVGNGVTISGTVGAALQAAADGIPALAVSLEVDPALHNSHATTVDFSVAGHFTAQFAQRLLAALPLEDLDVLKVDVPAGATPATPWRLTRQSKQQRYLPLKSTGPSQGEHSADYVSNDDYSRVEPGSDFYVLVHDRLVSVTPLSLDLTSRIDFVVLDGALKQEQAA